MGKREKGMKHYDNLNCLMNDEGVFQNRSSSTLGQSGTLYMSTQSLLGIWDYNIFYTHGKIPFSYYTKELVLESPMKPGIFRF